MNLHMNNGSQHMKGNTTDTSTRLDKDALEALLATSRVGRAVSWTNEVWDTVDSTNARALALAADGAPEGVIVAARQQTAGRGRLGRAWVSPLDTGLYMSFILRPNLAPTALPLISIAAGVAAACAVEKTCGMRAGLKWVNDVVHRGKKIGGILCEMQNPPAVVLGIGINLRLHPNEMPEEIRERADSIENITANPVDTNVMAAALCLEVERVYAQLMSNDRQSVLQQWKNYSATLGRHINAFYGTETTRGKAVDLAENGALVIETDEGERIVLHAGEVTIRNEDGTYA